MKKPSFQFWGLCTRLGGHSEGGQVRSPRGWGLLPGGVAPASHPPRLQQAPLQMQPQDERSLCLLGHEVGLALSAQCLPDGHPPPSGLALLENVATMSHV